MAALDRWYWHLVCGENKELGDPRASGVGGEYYGERCNLYKVSQEEWTKLRKSVPYVELYRYNPKHLYPKLNGYGDNGHQKVWASGVSTYCKPSMTPYSSTAHAGNEKPLAIIRMQCPWRDNRQLQPASFTWKPKDKCDSSASVFVVQFNGFMSLTGYFDVKYSY